MLKKLIAALAATLPLYAAAQEIPVQYRGVWSKTAECYDPAVIAADWFAPNTDVGMSKVVMIKPADSRELIVFGVESYRDEGETTQSGSVLEIRPEGRNAIYINGYAHASKFSGKMVRCNKRAGSQWNFNGTHIVNEKGRRIRP